MSFGRILKGAFDVSSRLFKNAALPWGQPTSSLPTCGPLSTGALKLGPSLSLRSLATFWKQPHQVAPVSSLLSKKGCVLQNVYNPVLQQQSRSKIYFSRTNKGPRTVKAVVERFFRLHNGLWIRPRAGRGKKRWIKAGARLNRLDQHVFCNKTQCRLLDRMVNRYWKERKFYTDDPYAPYHKLSHNPNYTFLKNKPRFVP